MRGAPARNVGICLLLIAASVAVFWPAGSFPFVDYDDQHYVAQNPMVLGGVTAPAVWRAFTTGYFSYWHPLTWISHMVDVELFGLNAGAHHWMSVGLHAAAAVLWFLVLYRWLRAPWAAAAAALFFAIHPMHVESVAWIAERKDVVSGLFWVLTVGAYFWYAERPSVVRYGIVLVFLACGLMSKPMVVTLPLVLLLLDYWPLRRLERLQPGPDPAQAELPAFPKVRIGRAWVEKVPMLGGSLLCAGLTMYSVHHGQSMVSTEQFSWGLRLGNVPISYARYLGKLFWPDGMTVIYPMPAAWPMGEVMAATALLLILSGIAAIYWRTRPYLLVGWLWFLGTIVPTLGVVSVGLQSIADRYTYVSYTGLFLAIGWGIRDLVWNRRALQWAVAVVTVGAGIACGVGAWQQTWVWNGTEALFAHAVRVTTNNTVAHYNLGLALAQRGEFRGAVPQFETTLRIDPKHFDARNNLSVMLIELGRAGEATNHLSEIVRRRPDHSIALYNWGRALVQLGDYDGAIERFGEVIRLTPNFAPAYYHLGVAWVRLGKTAPARSHLGEAIQLQPNWMEPRLELGRIYHAAGEYDAAVALLEGAKPSTEDERRKLEALLEASRRKQPLVDEARPGEGAEGSRGKP